jgi:hypothetical protein
MNLNVIESKTVLIDPLKGRGCDVVDQIRIPQDEDQLRTR